MAHSTSDANKNTGVFRAFLLMVAVKKLFAVILMWFVPFVSDGLAVTSISKNQVEGYIQQAKEWRLSQHPGWLALLHYKKEVFSRELRSQVDDKRFFLSESGYRDPERELVATLESMFSQSQDVSTQCRFPARWFWLKQQLFIPDNIYDASCPKFKHWFELIGSKSVSLIFPAMYLNNPGSAFGHTFLRFDGNESTLLSYALNYAAHNNPDDSLPYYIYSGLTGGYNGIFRARRYFETVESYSNIENRDIWEYELNLSSEEIQQVLRHVWEVQNMRFEYYFFRENCAYRLLALLEVVRPETGLTNDGFAVYAIPVDTVRSLNDAGYILKKAYRPSLIMQLEKRAELLGDEEIELSLKLADSDESVSDLIETYDSQTKISTLEQAYTWLQFKRLETSDRYEALLLARSRLPPDVNIEYQGEAPEEGHSSARFSLASGKFSDVSFFDVSLKPAFHELLDDPYGYVHGSEINVLDTTVRWMPDDERLVLQKLRLFNVTSLSPLTEWYKTMSWQFDVRFENRPLVINEPDEVFVAQVAGGVSKKAGESIVFAMADLQLDSSDTFNSGYGLFAGVLAGWLVPVPGGMCLLDGYKLNSVAGFDVKQQQLKLGCQFNVTSGQAIRFEHQRYRFDDNSQKESRLVYYWYY